MWVTDPVEPLGSKPLAGDILFPAPGHVVVAEWYGGVSVSRDSGLSWNRAPTRVPLKALTIGPRGRIWGLYGWRGIHESDSGAVCFSDDGGSSWRIVWFDPVRFVPQEFISHPHEEPVILATDGSLWRHQAANTESLRAWKPIGVPNPDGSSMAGARAGTSIYVVSFEHLWMSRNEGATWTGREIQGGAVAGGDEGIWVSDLRGSVYRATPGTLDLTLVASFPESSSRVDLWPFLGGCYVQFQSKGHRLRKVGQDGFWSDVSIFPEDWYSSVRADREGRAWAVGAGVFREGPDGGASSRVWPPASGF